MTMRKVGALSGLAYAVLFGLGSAATLIDSPPFGGSSEEALRYFTDHETLIYLANIVSILAVPFLLWFAAFLRTALDGPDPTSRLLARAASAGVTAAASVTAAEVMVLTVGILRLRGSGELTGEQAALLYDISTAIGGVAIPVCLAATQAAVAAAVFTERLPFTRAFGVFTLVLAVSASIIPISANLLFASLIWLAVLSIRLAVKDQPSGATSSSF